MDNHKRSLVKGISWRLFGSMATFILAFIFTRNINISLGISLVELVAKTLLFYIHERIWNKISWGKQSHQNIP